jgi:hypothetical protein
MPEVTRTVRHWRIAARRAQAAVPALAARVRATLADVAAAHLGEPLADEPITGEVAAASAAALTRLAADRTSGGGSPPPAGAVVPGTPAPLTPDEAAAVLGISPSAVRARLRRGTLPGTRIAGGWVVWLPVGAAPPPRPEVDLAALAALVERQGEEIRRLAAAAAAWEARASQAERRLADLAAGGAADPGEPSGPRPPPPEEPPHAAVW